MPKKIISRLWLVIDPDGMHRLTWDGGGMPIDFIGPKPLELPDFPMSKADYDQWTWTLCTREGYQMAFRAREEGLPKVESVEEADGRKLRARRKEEGEMPFPGFAEIKQQFPSAEAFLLRIRYSDSLPEQTDSLQGRVNAAEFEGRKPTTVYFVGAQSSSGNSLAKLVFVHRPEGWNTLFREETGRWEEVRHIETNAPPYEAADFEPLAALKLPDDLAWVRFGSPDPDLAGGDEPVESYEQAARNARVNIKLAWHEDAECPRTLLVTVGNVGCAPIPRMSVWWCSQNETPQPVDGLEVEAHALGGEANLIPERTFNGTLAPGETRPFLLVPSMLPALQSEVASLSPERYRIEVRCGDCEVTRIDGGVVGEFVERDQ